LAINRAERAASTFNYEWDTVLATDIQATAFAGLNPRLRQSGRFAGKVRLSECGSPQLRQALYMGTVAPLHCNHVLQAYYQRKLAEGKCPKSGIIACITELLQIVFAVLKTNRPFDPDYEAKRPAHRHLALQAA
jgi:transposase